MSRQTPREPEYRMLLDAVKREGDRRRAGAPEAPLSAAPVSVQNHTHGHPPNVSFWRRIVEKLLKI